MRLDEFIAQLEAAGWRSQLDAQHQRITELWRAEYPGAASYLDALEKTRTELAALRADAERYRWLRDKYTVSLLNGEHELRITYGPRASTKSGIDDIIDAARGGHMTRPRAALGER